MSTTRKPSPTRLGKAVQAAMDRRGANLAAVAARLDVAEAHLSRVIHGHRGLRPEFAIGLAQALSLRARDLLHLHVDDVMDKKDQP
jgi:plasmid maintenance system antidote protein VapI